MADVALPTTLPLTLTAPLAATPPATIGDMPLAGDSADPFAALLSGLTMTGAPAATPCAIALPATPVLASGPPALATELASPETIVAAAVSADDDDSDPAAPDPLGDAIAAGPTAVLALVQPPVTAAPVAAPPTSQAPAAPVAWNGRPIAKPVNPSPAQPIEASAPTPRADATAALSFPALSESGAPHASQPQPVVAEVQAIATPSVASSAPQAAAAEPAPVVQGEAPMPPAPAAAPVPDPTMRTTAAPAADRADPRIRPLTARTPAAPPAAKESVERPRTEATVSVAPLPQPIAPQRADAAPALPATAPVDSIVQQQLAITDDGQWLDQLARDIAQSARPDGSLQFRLSPEHLGALTVAIAHRDDGASIRLTPDTDAGRQILTEAQPRLIAEARAQGLKVAEAHVDLGQSGSNGGSASSSAHSGHAGLAQHQQQQQQQREGRAPLPDPQSFSRNAAGESERAELSDSPAELYA